MKNKVGQLILIGVSGETLTENEKRFIIENNISGVTLFGRNCKSPKQIYDLCSELHNLRHYMPDRTPLYIAVDMEGGRVARFQAPFTRWPAMKKFGEKDSPTLTFDFAFAMGEEMHAVGINVDWAPCADIFTNEKNTAIGDRSFGSDPELVARHVSAVIRGFSKTEIISCVKHFPGHGNTIVDSHEDLPVENLDMKRLEDVELIPFKKAIKNKISMIMTSHILFKNIDSNNPVTFSKKFLQEILRGQLGYQGLIVSDDLGMKALAKYHNTKDIPVKAIQAGVDLLLYCNEPNSPPLALEAMNEALSSGILSEGEIHSRHKRILEHKKAHLKSDTLAPWDDISKIIGSQDHLKVIQALS